MSLIAELKRRNVFRVGVAYAIAGWLLIEVASAIFPGLHLPDWTPTFLIVLVVAGFPLALVNQGWSCRPGVFHRRSARSTPTTMWPAHYRYSSLHISIRGPNSPYRRAAE